MYNTQILNTTREVLLQLFDKPYVRIQEDTKISRQTVSKYFRLATKTKVSTATILFESAIRLIKKEVREREILDQQVQQMIQEILQSTSNNLKDKTIESQ